MPSLVSLAEELLAQAKQVDEILVQNKIPYPSFDDDTLELLPDDAQKLRLKLLDTTHNFRQLLRGAKQGGLDIALNWTEHVILRVIWRYKLASAVPVHGSATYSEISAASGLSEPLVVRTIRAAIPLNIFEVSESEPVQVRHTATSRLLATDELYYYGVGLQLEDFGPASQKLIDAWEQFGEDIGDPDRSAWSLNNNGRSLFHTLAAEPERAHRFDTAMKYYIRDKGMNLDYILSAFDWSTLDTPGSTLIDLGGGHGQLSQILASKTTHLKFIVQDLPHVVTEGRTLLPPTLSHRITFETQDFLTPQPPRPSNTDTTPPPSFLISRCLHNWSDHHSTQILRALIPALQPNSHVLIWDPLIDEHPFTRAWSNRLNLQQDFIMATMSNGRERTESEFRRLVEACDARFVVEGVKRPEGSNLGLVCVRWRGEG